MKKHNQKGFLHVILALVVLFLAAVITVVVYKHNHNSKTSTAQSGHHGGSSQSIASSTPYIDKFITTAPVDLNQVASISKFRSCSGHDYSSANVDGQQETNRSMKHYINPLDSLVGTTNVITVFAPFDGTVAATPADASNNAQVGLQVWLTPAASPAWSYIFYHVMPLVKAGDSIKAGQLIAYANLSRSSVIDFDVALEAWVQNMTSPVGLNNQSNLNQALQRGGDYLRLLHGGQLDSIFNHMTPEVLAQFSAKGITVSNIIVSKTTRDAAPCPPPSSDGHYQSSVGDFVQLQ